jgi:UDPglucose 6-dehydrogenase
VDKLLLICREERFRYGIVVADSRPSQGPFIAQAADLQVGEALGFLLEVDAINLRRRTRAADLASELVGGDLTGVPICVLGAALKPGSDDGRDSPALDVAQILHGMGARVTVYDPAALANARRAYPGLGYAATVTEAAQDAHVVLLLTEWPEFAGLSPVDLGSVVARRNIVDGRNALDAALWSTAGWNYRALGVAATRASSRRSALRRVMWVDHSVAA